MSSYKSGDLSGRSSITRVDSSATSEPPSMNKTADERTPLITSSEVQDDAVTPQEQSKEKTPQAIEIILILLLVLGAVSDQLAEAPHVRIMEAVLCYRHYETADPGKILLPRSQVGPGAIGGVDEMWCKVEGVQSQLAMLQGYQTMLDGFPSLLLALPFGLAADIYGRKPLLILGILSFIVRAVCIQTVLWFWQSFNIRWVWLSSIHGLIAGSSPVISALFFTVVADIAPPANRSALFARLGASNLVPSAFVPLIAACLMTRNPWIPALAGTVAIVLCVPLVLWLPETLNYRHPHSTPSNSHPPSPTIEAVAAPPDPSTNRGQISLNFAGRWITAVRSSLAFLWADWRVPVLISTFFLHMLNAQVYPLLLQYTSKRYELKFSTATMVLTIRAILNCVYLLLILPWVSHFVMKRWNLSGQRKDLYLARLSLLLIGVGWLFVGASPVVALAVISMCITCLGAGAMYLIRGFLTSLVPAHHVARVYSLVSVVDTLGSMIGGPLIAALLSRGLAIGGIGIGLPFFFLGMASLVLFLLVCVIGMRKGEDDGHHNVVHEE